jgi:ornithine carbamoyltransferase
MNLVSLADLTEYDVREIWAMADEPDAALTGNVAWSFEGNGIRTRTTFIRAFQELGLPFTELPNLLKTSERVVDLAGYLDPFYDLYVIREADHDRMRDFAACSVRPVINAMSAFGHPCEVLADAYYLNKRFQSIERAHICLWGPPTNVFRSWHELAGVLGFCLTHVCETQHHEMNPFVHFQCDAPPRADVVITDAWPSEGACSSLALTSQRLDAMGAPALLPTPPFTIGRELLFDPVGYPGFVGYQQKQHLLTVQKAILRYALKQPTARHTP